VRLTLHLTTACNLRCSYCYSPPTLGPHMSSKVIQAALELAARLNERTCGIAFFGGEPLLHMDGIRETVSRARRMEEDGRVRFHFKITTNGLSLTDEVLDYSVRESIPVAMSFDGVREAHDRHRRTPKGGPSYELLLPRLRKLLERRPYSSVLTVVTPETAPYLARSMEFLLDLGVRYLIVSLNYDASWREDDLVVLEEQCRELGRLYVQWSEEGRKFYLSPFEVKLSSHVRCHEQREDRCELGQRQLSVDPAGHLYPCVQFTRAGPDSRWCIGNVFDGVDQAARGRIHDESEAEKSECGDCEIRNRCHSTCGCLNWQTTGSINRVSPVLCRYEQMLIPIVDHVGEVLWQRQNRLFLHKHYDPVWPIRSLVEDQRERPGPEDQS